MSEMCSNPSIPPRSTNAPKSVSERMVPGITEPSCNPSNAGLLGQLFRLLLEMTRRSTTRSSASLSSLVIRHSMVWPTSLGRSAMSRTPLRLAGMNARMPTSTRKPPLTASVTTPEMVLLLANAASRPRPVLRNFDLQGGKQNGPVLIAPTDGDHHFGAGGQPRIGRQNAVHLAANVHEHRICGDGDNGAFHRSARTVVGLVEDSRKNIAEGRIS